MWKWTDEVLRNHKVLNLALVGNSQENSTIRSVLLLKVTGELSKALDGSKGVVARGKEGRWEQGKSKVYLSTPISK